MYHVSAQGVDERMIYVRYYYYNVNAVLCRPPNTHQISGATSYGTTDRCCQRRFQTVHHFTRKQRDQFLDTPTESKLPGLGSGGEQY